MDPVEGRQRRILERLEGTTNGYARTRAGLNETTAADSTAGEKCSVRSGWCPRAPVCGSRPTGPPSATPSPRLPWPYSASAARRRLAPGRAATCAARSPARDDHDPMPSPDQASRAAAAPCPSPNASKQASVAMTSVPSKPTRSRRRRRRRCARGRRVCHRRRGRLRSHARPAHSRPRGRACHATARRCVAPRRPRHPRRSLRDPRRRRRRQGRRWAERRGAAR